MKLERSATASECRFNRLANFKRYFTLAVELPEKMAGLLAQKNQKSSEFWFIFHHL
jgi:hypothetical protein